MSHTPFGGIHQVTTNTGAPSAPELRFPGQWFQAETGLHQNWMRDYDPTTGRYLQANPLGLVDGPSVYGYARQGPGRYTDPRGLQTAGAALPQSRPLIPLALRACVAAVGSASTAIGAALGGAAAIILYPGAIGGDDTCPTECTIVFNENEKEKKGREKGDRMTDEDDALDQLEEIEAAQRDFRKGKRPGPIDSIEKSKQRAKNQLKDLMKR